jgi:hypothetical protein
MGPPITIMKEGVILRQMVKQFKIGTGKAVPGISEAQHQTRSAFHVPLLLEEVSSFLLAGC